MNVLSLFSGCGGLDIGFQKSGFKIVYANDINKHVKETYEYNLNHEIEIKDIRLIDKSKLPDYDVLLAGIPCTPFSNAGNRKSTKDKDGNLFKQVIDTINSKERKPKVVVFENVRGFLSSKDEKGELMTVRFVKEMKEIGYNTTYKLLNSSNFGVPSNRFRVIIVSVLSSYPKYEFKFDLYKSVPKITVGEVLKKPLPKDEIEEILKLSPQSLSIINHIPPGGSWKNIPYELLPERMKKIRNNMKRYGSPNFYRRFNLTEVMGTVTATSSPERSGILHPLENRRYSVREIARFQSFEDNFKFLGDSLREKYKMIGNSVPPKLSIEIAKDIKSQLF
jgi:DNA (cytosine-5)-methyltransferase 1